MAKTQKKWIVGTKRDSTSNIFTEFVTKPDEALTASWIPYDSTTSVYEAINNIVVGMTGAPGSTGTSGSTGPAGAPQGETGIQGIQGATGFGIQGRTGLRGLTGLIGSTGLLGNDGATGIVGSTGSTGILGVTGLQGLTGSGATGLYGSTGIQGLTGSQGTTGIQGYTGLIGSQGSTGVYVSQQSYFNPISRYETVSSVGREVWVVSSASVYSNLNWDRSGTALTLYKNSHGHIAGNRVIVRNTNEDYQAATIDATTLDSFQITTTNTGSSNGIEGAYSLGFTYAHSGGPSVSGGVLTAPSGINADCQLLSIRIRTGTRSGSIYDLVVPASAINGAGANTSLSDCYIPDFNVRSDTDLLTGVGATMTTNISGSYTTFQFGALGSSTSRFIVAHF